ncbi:MAG: IPT/TIG domain-containing protein [Actinobacteria bacterium]|nr:IPT/TIG domain-containing protein [Actinomycetota bacterium]
MGIQFKNRGQSCLTSRVLVAAIVTSLLVLAAASPALAAGARRWGDAAVQICTQAQNQELPRACSDNSGGAIVVWQDLRSTPNYDIYAAHVLANGTVDTTNNWGPSGEVLIAANVATLPQAPYPEIVSDGSGGARIGWNNKTGGVWDIKASRIDSDGSIPWGAGGVVVAATGNTERNPVICMTGSGDSVVAWEEDQLSGKGLVYAQRLDGSGVAQWAGPPRAKSDVANEDQETGGITSDGAGGAMLAMSADQSTVNWRAYVQRFDSAGAVQYGNDAQRVSTQEYTQFSEQIVPGDTGNFVITYQDMNGSGTNHAMFAQKVQASDGAGLWAATGLAVRTSGDNQGSRLSSDSNAAYTTWQNSANQVFAARLNFGGTLPWNLTVSSNAPSTTSNPGITYDGFGGAVVSWIEGTASPNYRAYAQWISSTGVASWGTPGLQVCTTATDQSSTATTSDGAGGAIDMFTMGGDLYGQRVSNATPTVTGITPDSANRGTTVNVTDLAGTNFYGIPTVELQKAGETSIAAYGVYVAAPGQITCDFDIPAGAALGAWDVYVENPDSQNATLVGGFTVNAPTPTVTSITPERGNRGATVQITDLAGTNFYGTPTVRLKKAGRPDISADNVNVVAANKMTCEFDIPLLAPLGPRDLYVQNPDGRNATLVDGFMVRSSFPVITGVTPDTFAPGDALTVEGSGFGDTQGMAASGGAASYVSFEGLQATEYQSWSDDTIECTAPAGVTTGDVTVVTSNGTSNAMTVTVVYPKWYLAEGTTAWGFDCYICVQNPRADEVDARITYMTDSGPRDGGIVTLPAASQTTVFPDETLGQQDFSTLVECLDPEKSIAVDRTMEWLGQGATTPEQHQSVGVTAPAPDWYLPEGSSEWGFECWLLIQNPNPNDVVCQVTYMIEGEGPVAVDHAVPANSRKTFNMADDIGAKDASIQVHCDDPVIPERAMYRNNRREGSDSIGTTTPAPAYYLAEGTSAWGFTTYVLIQNPSNADTEVEVTYMTDTGPVPHPENPIALPANSRKTIRVNDYLPNRDFSTTVEGEGPIIAERAMYWDNGTGEACHDSIGMDSPHMMFYLPAGQVGSDVETWTLVQNPNGVNVEVQVTYMTFDGTGNVTFTETVPANSRSTFNMADSGLSGGASVMVVSKTAGMPIMCERAMYWSNRGGGGDTIGGYAD